MLIGSSGWLPSGFTVDSSSMICAADADSCAALQVFACVCVCLRASIRKRAERQKAQKGIMHSSVGTTQGTRPTQGRPQIGTGPGTGGGFSGARSGGNDNARGGFNGMGGDVNSPGAGSNTGGMGGPCAGSGQLMRGLNQLRADSKVIEMKQFIDAHGLSVKKHTGGSNSRTKADIYNDMVRAANTLQGSYSSVGTTQGTPPTQGRPQIQLTLTANSKVVEMKDFIDRHGLPVKKNCGGPNSRTKADIYNDIVRALQARSATASSA